MQTFNGLNDSFAESMASLWTSGLDVQSRGSKQKELLFHNMKIEDPTDLSLEVPARRFNSNYALIEWLWYLSKDKGVKNIGKLAGIWQAIADQKNEVESNYGFLIFGLTNAVSGCNQWSWVIEELLKDRDTRRATISINQSWHKGKNNADYPCTQSLHFFIRDSNISIIEFSSYFPSIKLEKRVLLSSNVRFCPFFNSSTTLLILVSYKIFY